MNTHATLDYRTQTPRRRGRFAMSLMAGAAAGGIASIGFVLLWVLWAREVLPEWTVDPVDTVLTWVVDMPGGWLIDHLYTGTHGEGDFIGALVFDGVWTLVIGAMAGSLLVVGWRTLGRWRRRRRKMREAGVAERAPWPASAPPRWAMLATAGALTVVATYLWSLIASTYLEEGGLVMVWFGSLLFTLVALAQWLALAARWRWAARCVIGGSLVADAFIVLAAGSAAVGFIFGTSSASARVPSVWGFVGAEAILFVFAAFFFWSAWANGELGSALAGRLSPPRQLCPQCSYDLRATPDPNGPLLERCPECGRVVEQGTFQPPKGHG